MSKKKKRKVNVEMPGLENLEIPPDAPVELINAIKLMQKAYSDPESLSEQEFAAFMGMADEADREADAAIPPETRKRAADLGARAWKQYQRGDMDEAFETAIEALNLNPMEPAASLIEAMLGIDNDQEAFEAFGAVATQVQFELRKDNDAERTALLTTVGDFARVQAGIAAYQCGHFESAIGPLAETLEEGSDEHAGTAALFLVPALIGDEEAEEALRMIESAPEPHPVMDWGRVLALVALQKDSGEAFNSAMERAPNVYDFLVTAPLNDSQFEEALAAKDQDAFAAHLFRTLLKKRKGLRKALKQLVR